MRSDNGSALFWVVLKTGSFATPWYQERFYFLALGNDGAEDALGNFSDGIHGLRLTVKAPKGWSTVRLNGEDRMVHLEDLEVLDAEPAFLAQSGVAFIEAISVAVALVAGPSLDLICGGMRDGQALLNFIKDRAEGHVE